MGSIGPLDVYFGEVLFLEGRESLGMMKHEEVQNLSANFTLLEIVVTLFLLLTITASAHCTSRGINEWG